MFKEYADQDLQALNACRTAGGQSVVRRAWSFDIPSAEYNEKGKAKINVAHVRQLGEGPDAIFIYHYGQVEKIFRNWTMVTMELARAGYHGKMPNVPEYAFFY